MKYNSIPCAQRTWIWYLWEHILIRVRTCCQLNLFTRKLQRNIWTFKSNIYQRRAHNSQPYGWSGFSWNTTTTCMGRIITGVQQNKGHAGEPEQSKHDVLNGMERVDSYACLSGLQKPKEKGCRVHKLYNTTADTVDRLRKATVGIVFRRTNYWLNCA